MAEAEAGAAEGDVPARQQRKRRRKEDGEGEGEGEGQDHEDVGVAGERAVMCFVRNGEVGSAGLWAQSRAEHGVRAEAVLREALREAMRSREDGEGGRRRCQHVYVVAEAEAGAALPLLNSVNYLVWDLQCDMGCTQLEVKVLLEDMQEHWLPQVCRPRGPELCALGPRDDERHILDAALAAAGLPAATVVPLSAAVTDLHFEDCRFLDDLDSAGSDTPLRFDSVAMGGTFDRMHQGHHMLLTAAALICTGTLTVGVTSDDMLKKKKNASMIAPVEERAQAVADYLAMFRDPASTRIVTLTDPFGPPACEAAFQALVASSETLIGARKLNDIRRERGFEPLTIVLLRREQLATLSSTYRRTVQHQQQQAEQQP